MQIIDIISNVVLPRWFKVSLLIILVFFFGAYITVGAMGLLGGEPRKDWITASAYILGILLPILLVGFVVLFADTGPSALQRRSYKYLTTTLPRTSVIFEDARTRFAGRTPSWQRLTRKADSTRVRMAPSPGGESVLYEFIAPVETDDALRRMLVRVQLNVRKANVVLYLPESDTLSTNEVTTDGLFPHAMAGAKAEGYEVNPSHGRVKIGNDRYVAFVLIKTLPENFLLRSTDQLYFAQDLMFLLRAALNEAPGMFELARKRNRR